MAFKQFLVDLDLTKNQLLNAVVQNLATAPSSPADGQIYWSTADDTLYVWSGSAWMNLGSDGVTNLSYTAGASSGTVVSDTGSNATIPLADGTNAGLMTASQKVKLDGIDNGAATNVTTNLSEGTTTTTSVDVNSSDGTNATIAQASSSRAGVLSSAKFDEIVANNAKVSNVSHPLVEKAVPSNAVFTDTETVTSISISANVITYVDENGNDTDIDLTTYLDDSNLARLTSGALNGSTGLATFTRDDASTFTIDMSAFLDAITLNNTLTSTSTTEGLTANQGKILKDTIDALVDTNTQLSDGDIAAMGYIKTYTDTNTQLSDSDITALGYIKTDTNTQLSDSDIGALGYVKTDNDTQLSDAEITALGYIKTYTDTNTQLSDGDISGLGYVKGVNFNAIGGSQTDLSLSGFTDDLVYGTVNKVQVDCAAATSTTITHSLGQYVDVNVYKKTSPFNLVEAQVVSTSATTVVVTFNVAPSAGQYVIVVKG